MEQYEECEHPLGTLRQSYWLRLQHQPCTTECWRILLIYLTRAVEQTLGKVQNLGIRGG